MSELAVSTDPGGPLDSACGWCGRRRNAQLTSQLRGAAILGRWLIEEADAGRLKVPYGSPHVR